MQRKIPVSRSADPLELAVTAVCVCGAGALSWLHAHEIQIVVMYLLSSRPETGIYFGHETEITIFAFVEELHAKLNQTCCHSHWNSSSHLSRGFNPILSECRFLTNHWLVKYIYIYNPKVKYDFHHRVSNNQPT